MEFPKAEIYKLIQNVKIKEQEIDYVQNKPKKFKSLPCISFCNLINTPKFAFKNRIYSEKIDVQIDIWSKGSAINTLILKELLNIMQENGWTLITAQDMDNTNGIYRIMTKFRKVLE